jgi:alkylation response protein AidB-like acyl-CoA dehydrogenase
VGVVSSAGACREAADLIVAYATGAISYRKARRRLLFQFPRVAFRLARVAVSA